MDLSISNSHIVGIDLSDHGLEVIPEELAYFTHLEELRIKNCKIQKIEGLDNLEHLRILNLSVNKIKIIEGLENLTKLQELSLLKNPLIIPKVFFK